MIVTIRPLKNDSQDMEVLLSWLQDARVLAHVYDEDAPWTLEKVCKSFAEKCEPDSVVHGWMILDDQSPVGYMQHYPVTRDSYRFTHETPFSIFQGAYGIDMFIGIPELWRHGIGRQAVNLLANHLQLQGISRLCVDPAVANDHGMQFWQKIGFVPIGTVPEYDHPEQLSMLMLRNI